MSYDTLATQESIDKTLAGLKERGFEGIVVENGAAALAKIKELIPGGATVMNGSSVTLEQIGYIDYLKEGTHGWINPKTAILAETDKAKQNDMRKHAVVSDVYLGSVHGLAETGEIVIASNSGSQMPHLVFTSPHLILVVSTKKIVPTLAEAIDRLETHVVPLEDKHMLTLSGGKYGTMLSKMLVLKHENPMFGRKVHVMLVKENLGF